MAASASRRLLLVSYHFGPSASTGGFRWAATLPYLRASGWNTDVLTATPIAEIGRSWAAIGATVTVVEPANLLERVGSKAFSAVHSARVRLGRGRVAASTAAGVVSGSQLRNLVDAIPIYPGDFGLGLWSAAGRTGQGAMEAASLLHWSVRAARAGSKLWNRHRYDAVVVSGPPHWTQLAGVLIARGRDVPLVLDLRDPWAVGVPELNAYEPRLMRKITERVEAGLQRRATAVIHNTDLALRRALEFTPPLAKVRRVAIPNGYDDPPPAIAMDHSTFRILFSGWLYPFMDPRPLLQAAATLVARHDLSPERLRIQFVGSPSQVGDVPLRDIIRAYGLDRHADVLPRMERHKALELQAQAAVLVAFDCPHPLAVPMKVYDYLQMPGTLLLFAEPGSSLHGLAERVGSRAVVPGDTAGISYALEGAFASWRQGLAPGPHDPDGIFHRSCAARATHELLESLVLTH